MKLNDIDILISARSTFTEKHNVLTSVRRAEMFLRFGGITITDATMQRAVRAALVPLAEAQFDEAKTKLMMLGITEFPPE